MILPIVYYNAPILREKGKPIDGWDTELESFTQVMIATMKNANGVGLASQQLGKALQIAIVDVTEIKEPSSKMWLNKKLVDPMEYMPMVLINPHVQGTRTKVRAEEGCLSFPNLGIEVSRSKRVRIKNQTRKGEVFEFEAEGFLARAIQHEYDHLHGKLFIDYVPDSERRSLKEKLLEMQEWIEKQT